MKVYEAMKTHIDDVKEGLFFFRNTAAALGVFFYYGNPIFTVVYYLRRLSRLHLTDKGAFDDVRANLSSQ